MSWKVDAIFPSRAEPGQIAVRFLDDAGNEATRTYRDKQSAAGGIPVELETLRIRDEMKAKAESVCAELREEFCEPVTC